MKRKKSDNKATVQNQRIVPGGLFAQWQFHERKQVRGSPTPGGGSPSPSGEILYYWYRLSPGSGQGV